MGGTSETSAIATAIADAGYSVLISMATEAPPESSAWARCSSASRPCKCRAIGLNNKTESTKCYGGCHAPVCSGRSPDGEDGGADLPMCPR